MGVISLLKMTGPFFMPDRSSEKKLIAERLQLKERVGQAGAQRQQHEADRPRETGRARVCLCVWCAWVAPVVNAGTCFSSPRGTTAPPCSRQLRAPPGNAPHLRAGPAAHLRHADGLILLGAQHTHGVALGYCRIEGGVNLRWRQLCVGHHGNFGRALQSQKTERAMQRQSMAQQAQRRGRGVQQTKQLRQRVQFLANWLACSAGVCFQDSLMECAGAFVSGSWEQRAQATHHVCEEALAGKVKHAHIIAWLLCRVAVVLLVVVAPPV